MKSRSLYGNKRRPFLGEWDLHGVVRRARGSFVDLLLFIAFLAVAMEYDPESFVAFLHHHHHHHHHHHSSVAVTG